MKEYMYKCGLRTAVAVLMAFAASGAHATQVLTVPYSAAQINPATMAECSNYFDVSIRNFPPGLAPCELDFPIAIPAGSTIAQITVFHGGDQPGGAPYVEAWLQVSRLAPPAHLDELYDSVWNGFNPVVVGDLLLANKIIPVQAFTTFQVVVNAYEGAAIEGIAVLYN